MAAGKFLINRKHQQAVRLYTFKKKNFRNSWPLHCLVRFVLSGLFWATVYIPIYFVWNKWLIDYLYAILVMYFAQNFEVIWDGTEILYSCKNFDYSTCNLWDVFLQSTSRICNFKETTTCQSALSPHTNFILFWIHFPLTLWLIFNLVHKLIKSTIILTSWAKLRSLKVVIFIFFFVILLKSSDFKGFDNISTYQIWYDDFSGFSSNFQMLYF